MWDECRRVIDKDFHVRQRMRCVAFIISFEGETAAEFYQRLLKLEQGLLDHLFDLMDRVYRRGHFRASTVAPIRTKPTRTPHTGRQLHIANVDRQACGGVHMVRDEDGSWVHSPNKAAKQVAATLREKGGEYVECIRTSSRRPTPAPRPKPWRPLDCAERVEAATAAAGCGSAPAEFVVEATAGPKRGRGRRGR